MTSRKAQKGSPMQNSPQSAPAGLPQSAERILQPRKRDDLTYQAVTVAAILLLLGSLWLF
jgi:hypothetical protein